MVKLKNIIKEEAEKVSETLSNLVVFKKTYNIRILILLLFLVLNTNGKILPENYTDSPGDLAVEYNPKFDSTTFINNIKSNTTKQLVIEVGKFIDKTAPKNQLSSNHLVQVCQTYDLDIVFVLAQAMLESHFGTKGVAVKTNSIFNVGTYDDGQILYRYNHPDESIEPYAQLLVRRYLVDKEISNLLQDKGYVNDNGYRFASSKIYEASLRKLMIRIDQTTPISTLQGIVNMEDNVLLAFFGPDETLSQYNYLYAIK